MPRVDFVAEAEHCPGCGEKLWPYKSKVRTVITLAHGPFEAHEILKRCERDGCCPVGSRALRRLVKPGQRYGYDLIVHVGLDRYLAGRQRAESLQGLREQHGIELCEGSFSTLCDRFLSLFEALHVERAPQLRTAQQGGYPLHIDATCDHGKGGLFVCLDGWRTWVLWAGRVPSENVEHLAPLVDKTVKLFGKPIAVMRDMGDGGAQAAAALRKAAVADLVCHYHFLAAVGAKLFDKQYDQLRAIIRQTATRSDMWKLLRALRHYGCSEPTEGHLGPGHVRDDLKALVLWVLQADGSNDAPYPFALPHFEFVRRSRQAAERAERWVPRPRTQPESRALAQLTRLVDRLEHDPGLAPTMQDLEDRWRVFSELRDVLRLSNAELPRADARYQQRQLPALELLRLEQIEREVEAYQAELEQCILPEDRGKCRPSSPAAIVVKYLKRYHARLFGHPAQFDTDGNVIAVVDRTNNVIEHFFGQEKRRLRRRLGRAQLGRDLEQQPAQVALVSNLRCPEYVRLLCGSLEQLPAAFAELDMQAPVGTGSLTREYRDKQLQRRVRELLKDTEPPPSVRPVADQAERRGLPQLEPVDICSRWPELEQLSEDELRARCTAVFAPPDNRAPQPKPRDPRLPPAGTVLRRRFNDRLHRVTVLEDSFEYRGEHYARLSSVSAKITGYSCNGYKFFRLNGSRGGHAAHTRKRRPAARTFGQLEAAL